MYDFSGRLYWVNSVQCEQLSSLFYIIVTYDVEGYGINVD